MSYAEPNPRLVKSQPWASIDKVINELIDKIIFDDNELVVDDDIPDLIDDPVKRLEAIKDLQDRLKVLLKETK